MHTESVNAARRRTREVNRFFAEPPFAFIRPSLFIRPLHETAQFLGVITRGGKETSRFGEVLSSSKTFQFKRQVDIFSVGISHTESRGDPADIYAIFPASWLALVMDKIWVIYPVLLLNLQTTLLHTLVRHHSRRHHHHQGRPKAHSSAARRGCISQWVAYMLQSSGLETSG